MIQISAENGSHFFDTIGCIAGIGGIVLAFSIMLVLA